MLVAVGPVDCASLAVAIPSTNSWLLTPPMVTATVVCAFGFTAVPRFTCAPLPLLIASSIDSASPFVFEMPTAGATPATLATFAFRGISPREHASSVDICTPVACIPPAVGAVVGCWMIGAAPTPCCTPKNGDIGCPTTTPWLGYCVILVTAVLNRRSERDRGSVRHLLGVGELRATKVRRADAARGHHGRAESAVAGKYGAAVRGRWVVPCAARRAGLYADAVGAVLRHALTDGLHQRRVAVRVTDAAQAGNRVHLVQ